MDLLRGALASGMTSDARSVKARDLTAEGALGPSLERVHRVSGDFSPHQGRGSAEALALGLLLVAAQT